MKLKADDIRKIAALILKNLQEKSLIVTRAGGDRILNRIEAVFTKNLQEEEAIEEEVRKIMEQYKSRIASGSIDPQKAYMMIKKQVAKDRKFVL